MKLSKYYILLYLLLVLYLDVSSIIMYKLHFIKNIYHSHPQVTVCLHIYYQRNRSLPLFFVPLDSPLTLWPPCCSCGGWGGGPSHDQSVTPGHGSLPMRRQQRHTALRQQADTAQSTVSVQGGYFDVTIRTCCDLLLHCSHINTCTIIHYYCYRVCLTTVLSLPGRLNSERQWANIKNHNIFANIRVNPIAIRDEDVC